MVRSQEKYTPEIAASVIDSPGIDDGVQTVEIGDIIKSYDNLLVKGYCWGRFKILRQSFLDEIGQYLPTKGKVLDIGCGFGLFSQYYAMRFPGLEIVGIDRNAARIDLARRTAAKLGLTNVTYEVADATSLDIQADYDGAYMLDVVHHIPRDSVLPLLQQIRFKLSDNGRLIIKDVDTRPAYKRWFTYVLDKMMDWRTPVNYWDREELIHLFREIGYKPFYHSMPDILPYPHMLYVCHKA